MSALALPLGDFEPAPELLLAAGRFSNGIAVGVGMVFCSTTLSALVIGALALY